MEKCLTFSPKRRIDVSEALKHPYLEVSSVAEAFLFDEDAHGVCAHSHITTQMTSLPLLRLILHSLILITEIRFPKKS
jgi:hypothetical protein